MKANFFPKLSLAFLLMFTSAEWTFASEKSSRQCAEIFASSAKQESVWKKVFEEIWSKFFSKQKKLKMNQKEFHQNAGQKSDQEDIYRPHNKDTDPESRGSEETKIASRFYQSHEDAYYIQNIYHGVNAFEFRMLPFSRKELRRVDSADPHAEKMEIDLSLVDPSRSQAWPFGYQPVSFQVQSSAQVRMLWGPQGLRINIQGTPKSSDKVLLFLEKVKPRSLSQEEHDLLIRVEDAFSLNEFPAEWIQKVKELKTEFLEKRIDAITVAHQLSDWIAETMKYQVDQNSSQGVLEFCRSGKFQCDGAALVLTYILRSYFQIPSIPVAGVLGSYEPSEPQISLVLTSAIGHAFVLVYNTKSQMFEALDPTPSELTRPKKNQKEDPSFRQQEPRTKKKKEKKESSSEDKEKQGSDKKSSDNEKDRNFFWKEFFSQSPKLLKTEVLEKWLASNGRQERSLESKKIEIRKIEELIQISQRIHPDVDQQIHDFIQDGDSVEQMRQNYLRWRWLSLVSEYGKLYAEGSQKEFYSKVDSVTKQIGRYLHFSETKQSKKVAVQSVFPGNLSKEMYELGKIPQRQLNSMLSLSLKSKVHTIHRSLPVGSYRKTMVPYSTNHGDFDYIQAEDFEHRENFERGGLPSKYDPLLVAMGEMQAKMWLDEEVDPRSRRKNLKGPLRRPFQEDTYILVDLSASNDMYGGRPGFVRDMLVQNALDQMMTSNPQGRIYIMGYRGDIIFTHPIESLNAAKSYYENMISSMKDRTSFYPNGGGNDLAQALKTAFLKIKSQERTATRVNFRIFTDGEDNISAKDLESLFQEERKQLRETKSLDNSGNADFEEMSLTAVTFVDGNSTLEKFVQRNKNRSSLTGSNDFYQYLSLQDVTEIYLGIPAEKLQDMAHLLPEDLDQWSKIPNYIWQGLRQQLQEGRLLPPLK